MVRRPLRPSFSPGDQGDLIEAMRRVRHLAIMCASAERFGSEVHQRCDDLKVAIDRLAGELTGNPEFFWTQLRQSSGHDR